MWTARLRLALRLPVAFVLVAAGCAGVAEPELSPAPPIPTPAPTATPVPTPLPVAEPTRATDPTATPAPAPTSVPASTRGVTDQVVRIGVVKSGDVFGDVETGVLARLSRLDDGAVAGRAIEVVGVIDDGGDPDLALDAVRTMVETDEVFAIVLASSAATPAVTDYLAEQAVPFFGWGFAPGFCAPNEWGFGFNGCLLGAVLGLDDATAATAVGGLVDAVFGEDARLVLGVSDDPAGNASAVAAARQWGDRLTDVVVVEEDRSPAQSAALLDRDDPDVILLSVGLDTAVALKSALRRVSDAALVDDVTYLPGLLADFSLAERIEGTYAITQIPPQEEYRSVTGVIAADLDAVGGPVVYSQAVSVGYWATDLLVALLDATGTALDTRSFHERVVRDGVTYDPGLDGAPCSIDTTEIQHRAAGGAALVQVAGGIYRPVAAFTCF